MNLWAKMEQRLPETAAQALVRLGELAQSQGYGLYLVGGAVRDILLGRRERPDLDIAVEGDAAAFALHSAVHIDARITVHKRFGTATLNLLDDSHIDFATVRTETYKRPGALPIVKRAESVHEDLKRRDFTVNAMAMSLRADDRGLLIDPHNGRADLENGLLRVMHPQSFADDPTRILRGLRFRSRFQFEFEHETQSLLHTALGEYYLQGVSGARVRKEIQACLEEPQRVDIIKELNRLDIDNSALAPGLALHTELLEPVDHIAGAIKALDRLSPQLWVACLLAAAWGTMDETMESLARRLSLTRKQAAPFFNPLLLSYQARAELEDPDTSPEQVEDLLSGADDEVLVLLHAAHEHGPARGHIERFVNDTSGVRLEITGGDLLGMGHEPSPIFGQVLREVRRHKIQGKVKNRRQELSLARKLLDTWD